MNWRAAGDTKVPVGTPYSSRCSHSCPSENMNLPLWRNARVVFVRKAESVHWSVLSYFSFHSHCSTSMVDCSGSEILGAISPGRLNFVRWRLVFLGAPYATCFALPFLLAPRILRCFLDFWKNLWPRGQSNGLVNSCVLKFTDRIQTPALLACSCLACLGSLTSSKYCRMQSLPILRYDGDIWVWTPIGCGYQTEMLDTGTGQILYYLHRAVCLSLLIYTNTCT